MEEIARKRFIATGKSIPKIYMSARQIAEYEEVKTATISLRIKEIQEQVKAGRYPKTAIMDTMPVKVNFYAYYDYMCNRKRLRDKHLKKFVEPFNPGEIAYICPIVQETIMVTEE